MTTIYIPGMMCKHCAKRVEDALKKAGCDARVELDEKRAVITGGEEPGDEAIIAAISGAGYVVERIDRG